jgi:tetratricopeptide (TPR) repeat protein
VITKTGPKLGVSGTIQDESPKGIRLKGKELIPADEIIDVHYTDSSDGIPVTIRLDLYNPAIAAEAKIATSKNRQDALSTAIDAYRKVLDKLKGSKYDSPRRHIEFKIAYLTAQKAEAGEKKLLTDAINKLKDFKLAYPKSWQYPRVMVMWALLLEKAEKYDEAEGAYQELADKTTQDDLHDQYQMMVAKVAFRPGNYEAALTKFKSITGKLRKARSKAKAEIYQAECLAGLKKIGEATTKLKTILAGLKPEDKDLRAAVHNGLGYCYKVDGHWKDALYEFLWVDVIYNQNKEEHARALYYLAELFEKLKDTERAKECRQKLKGKQFAGTEYQARLGKG